MFLGPHRLADYDDAREPFRVPTAPKPGAVLGAVKDKPFRARLRASLTAPARDASSAAQAGTRKRPPSRTRKRANPDCEGRTRKAGWMKGRLLRGWAFPVPIPTRCREAGNGNRERSADQGFARR